MSKLIDDLKGRPIYVEDSPEYEQELINIDSKKLKSCILCGKSFIPQGRRVYCGRQHYTVCINCGKRVDFGALNFRAGFVPKTCCKACADAIGVQTFKENCLEKYGVTNPMYVQEFADKAFLKANPNLDLSMRKATEVRKCKTCGKEFTVARTDPKKCCSTECATKLREQHVNTIVRKCKLCGKPFTSNYGKSLYCSDIHYRDCVICGKSFVLSTTASATQTCSEACRQKLSEQTNMEHSGVRIGSQSEIARNKLRTAYYASNDKRINTCRERYGVDNPTKSPVVRNKISNAVKSEECQQKITDTCMKKYGVPHSSQSPEVHKKNWNTRKNIKAEDGTPLDSSYEVLVYNFWKSLGLEVERNIPIEYEYGGKIHTTFIDFRVGNILFEVKGLPYLEGVYDYSGIPIPVKLDIYRKYHVIVITDKSDTTMNLFGKPNSTESNGLKYLDKCSNPLIGVDVTLFEDVPEFPYAEDRPKCFYDVKVDGKLSAFEAFSDPVIRWKMINNRIQYSGGFIDNRQVLTAMNVTRTCKQPSWFSKSLANRLISTYCSQPVVYDLAAGWGARCDACNELNKTYVACDYNKDLVDWHHANNRNNIWWHDGRTFTYDMPCSIFICPPYSDPTTGKCFEDYNFDGFDDSAQSLTQCQWLLIAMKNAKAFVDATMVCKVVDPGWEDYIVEILDNKSHFGINHEYVIHLTYTQYAEKFAS